MFEIEPRKPRMLARQGFRPRAFAPGDRIDDCAMLRLRAIERSAERGHVGLLVEKRAGRCKRQARDPLDLAYVAAGRLDAFWEMGLSPWDMAAGALLIQEAGGLTCDLEGEGGYLASGDMVAASPKVLQELLSALK